MVKYFGDNQAAYTLMAEAATVESQTTGLWIDILSTYFKQYENFAVDAEVRHADGKRSDLVVFYGSDRKSTTIIVECKGKDGDSWEKARRQTWDYIVGSVKKKKNPTIGIIANGDQFIMIKVPGSGHKQGDPKEETIQVGVDLKTGSPISKGTPSNVVDQAAALEELLLKVKGDAQHGVFKNE